MTTTTGSSKWLFGFGDKGRCGLFDSNGKVVVELPGDSAESTNVGVTFFRRKHLYGVMNRKGKVLHEPKYESPILTEGIWRVTEVKDNGRLGGFLNGDGTIIIDCQYDVAWSFFEGLATVRKGKVWQFIDPEGTVVLQPKAEGVGCFGDGLVAVKVKGKWGYIDKQGNMVIEPSYAIAEPFHDGVAVVGRPGKVGIIGRDGNVIVKPSFGTISNSSEGLLAARRSIDEDYGYLGTNGDWQIPPRFLFCDDFSEGLGPVMLRGGRCRNTFVDHSGNQVVPPFAARTCSGFVGGLAEFQQPSDYFGYIDRKGNVVWKPTKNRW